MYSDCTGDDLTGSKCGWSAHNSTNPRLVVFSSAPWPQSKFTVLNSWVFSWVICYNLKPIKLICSKYAVRIRFRVCVQVIRSDVCTRWVLNTCRPIANPSPAFLVVATCDRLTVVISTSHVWNLLCMEDVRLHTPALQTGTHFLLTLETIVFLFHLLSATSKPFSSLSTRLAHAARLGFFY